MTQDKGPCAAQYYCNCRNMPLVTRHRCAVCAFCVHPECGIELAETGAHKIPSTNVNMVCKACAHGGEMMNELSLRHYAVNKYLRPKQQKIELMTPEEELVTSSSESSSGDSTEEAKDLDDAMDIDKEEEKKKEKDTREEENKKQERKRHDSRGGQKER